MNTFVIPSHLSVSKPATTALDSQESLQGGNASRVKRAEEFVKARRTILQKPKVQAEITKTEQKVSLENKQNAKPAVEQVDANELSASIALKGADGKRKKFPAELNKKILNALVPNANGINEIMYLSMKHQVTSKENLRSKVDLIFEGDSEKQALLKITILEGLLAESDDRGLTKNEIKMIEKASDKIYQTHENYINQSRKDIINGVSYANENGLSVKQGIKIFQIISSSKEQILHGILPFFKMVVAKSQGNIRQELIEIRKSIQSSASRENLLHDSSVTKQRSHIIQARIGFVNHAIQMIDDYSRILSLIESNRSIQ